MQQHSPPPQRPALTEDLPGATSGLVLGILSIVVSFPVLGLILGYRASRDAKALNLAHPGMYRNGGMAEAGYICSIVGIVIGSITTLCGCGYFALLVLSLLGMAGLAGAAGAGT